METTFGKMTLTQLIPYIIIIVFIYLALNSSVLHIPTVVYKICYVCCTINTQRRVTYNAFVCLIRVLLSMGGAAAVSLKHQLNKNEYKCEYLSLDQTNKQIVCERSFVLFFFMESTLQYKLWTHYF